MPATKALTDTFLRSLKRDGRRHEIPDRDGLVVRVSPRGTATFAVWCRVRGAGSAAGERVARLAGDKRRITIGEYPTVSLAEARERAAKIRRQARAGVDPTVATGDAAQGGPTVAALIDRYAVEHLRRNLRTAKKIEQVLRLHVGTAWGDRAVASLTRADLKSLLEKVRVPQEVQVQGVAGIATRTRGGPGAAADVRKWTRALLQFAVEHSLVGANPFAGVKNADKQRRGDRVLDMDELRAVWDAAGEMGYPWGPFFRLLLLTGNRRGEWANARWEWLKEGGTRLEIPAAFYKTGRPHVVPLAAQARAIIAQLPRDSGPFIFSTDGGHRPSSGFSKAKARLDQILAARRHTALRPWHVHDLRRSMATHMERIRVSPHVIEVCLGHVLKGVEGVYRHYGYIDEKADALQHWANEVCPADIPGNRPVSRKDATAMTAA